MKLLDEIIDLAAGEQGSVATLLRKCLVLAYALKNDRLKVWAEKELNGYDQDDENIPEYRKATAPAKGFFVGSFGSQLNDQPIPPATMEKAHRHYAESVNLSQPVKSYEGTTVGSSLIVEWPANLTLLYQSKMFGGRFVLNRAWQEIPASIVVGLIDTIKTRVLRFTLDLRDELGLVNDDLNGLPKQAVDQRVIAIILGGNNVIGSTDVSQINLIQVPQGDWTALAEVLEGKLGLKNSELAELKSALDHDKNETTAPGLGKRAGKWLKDLSKKSGEVALKLSVEVMQKLATDWILQYLGHHGH